MLQQARGNGYRANYIPLKVGLKGVPHYQSFAALASVLDMTNKDLMTLITNTRKAAIQGFIQDLVFLEQNMLVWIHSLFVV